MLIQISTETDIKTTGQTITIMEIIRNMEMVVQNSIIKIVGPKEPQ